MTLSVIIRAVVNARHKITRPSFSDSGRVSLAFSPSKGRGKERGRKAGGKLELRSLNFIDCYWRGSQLWIAAVLILVSVRRDMEPAVETPPTQSSKVVVDVYNSLVCQAIQLVQLPAN